MLPAIFTPLPPSGDLEQHARKPPLVLACLRRIQPNDVEHCEDGLARGPVGEFSVEAQGFEQLVYCAVVVFARRQQDAQPVAGAWVRRVRRDLASDVLPGVFAREVLEEKPVLEHLSTTVRWRSVQERFGLRPLAARDEDVRQAHDRIYV